MRARSAGEIMRIGGIVVVALLAAVVAVLLIAPRPAPESQPKPDRAVARAAAEAGTVRQSPSPLRTAPLRLPPPPAVRKPATRATPARQMVTPLRPSKPPARKPPAKRITPLAGKKTPAPALAKALAKALAVTEPASVTISPATRKAGRALLRLLEHGKGPSVEIAWPDAARERTRLHRLLGRCYGMRLAVMDGADRLFAASGPAGSPWRMDLDRFSGFLRAPAGQPVADEGRIFARLARRHRLADWRPVRIFPRAVDAVLLGGLQNLVGAAYGSADAITAAYALRGRRLMLNSIRVDGRAVAGAVELTSAAGIGCRPGA